MLIQKQNNKLMLQEIKLEMQLQMQEYFFFIEEAKKNRVRFFTRNCEIIVILFYFDIMSI